MIVFLHSKNLFCVLGWDVEMAKLIVNFQCYGKFANFRDLKFGRK